MCSVNIPVIALNTFADVELFTEIATEATNGSYRYALLGLTVWGSTNG